MLDLLTWSHGHRKILLSFVYFLGSFFGCPLSHGLQRQKSGGSEGTSNQEDKEQDKMPGPQDRKLAFFHREKTVTLIYTVGWLRKSCLSKAINAQCTI